MIDDISRGCSFQIPPCRTQYPWEALAGVIVQAEILHRRAYPVYQWEDKAIQRAYQYLLFLHRRFGYWFDEGTVAGDDSWQPWIVNLRHGIRLPAVTPARPGKIMGWTDWTHGPDRQ